MAVIGTHPRGGDGGRMIKKQAFAAVKRLDEEYIAVL